MNKDIFNRDEEDIQGCFVKVVIPSDPFNPCKMICLGSVFFCG